jgi:bifunctional polynucleotide phosphatase/kinase
MNIDPRFESETDMSFSENEPMAESLADAFKVQSLDNSDNVWNFIETGDSCDEISVLHGNFGIEKKTLSNVCFDLDSTIIKPLNGRKFSQDQYDWMFLYQDIPEKLKMISKSNNIIIFTNQLGLKTKEKTNTFKLKIEMMYKVLDVPFKIFASTHRNMYRKPCIGMWSLVNFQKDLKERFIYIGDAAGRKGDFSGSDRKFAENVGIPFFTPEEYFLNNKPIKPLAEDFSPYTFQREQGEFKEVELTESVIVLVGFPGSGKSSYAKKLDGYEVINQDTLKTKAKVLKKVESCMVRKTKCVIDSTNVSKENRKEYIDLAVKHNVSISVIEFTKNLDICKHNNMFRFLYTDSKLVPALVYNIMSKKYISPTKEEGFENVFKLPFTVKPEPTTSLSRWRQWLN